jgi:hypothetical protein
MNNANKTTLKFSRFFGPFINGKAVALYETGSENGMLFAVVETIGGKRLGSANVHPDALKRIPGSGAGQHANLIEAITDNRVSFA